MRNVRATYYGSGTLSLQMRRFNSNQTIVCRLDDILPSEMKKYHNEFLILEMDGSILNIGDIVPVEKAVEAVKNNPKISTSVVHVKVPTGFYIKHLSDVSRILPVEEEVIKPVVTSPPVEEKPAEPVTKVVPEHIGTDKEEKKKKKNKKMDEILEEI